MYVPQHKTLTDADECTTGRVPRCLPRLLHTLLSPAGQEKMTLFNAKRKIRMAIYTLITCQQFSGGGLSDIVGMVSTTESGQECNEGGIDPAKGGREASDGTLKPPTMLSSLDTVEQSGRSQTFSPGSAATKSTATRTAQSRHTEHKVRENYSDTRRV